jgi:Na+/citrate or Na+/malate symporter
MKGRPVSDSVSFLRRGPISPQVHGTLDYLLAATLIAAPLVLHFHDDTAKVFMLAVGGAASLLAIGTVWSRGIIRVLPPVLHGVADIGATIALIAAPFVFGFSVHTLALVVYVVVGAGGLGATPLTRFESDLEPAAGMTRIRPAA